MKGLKKVLTGILAGAMALSLTLSAGSGIKAKAADVQKTTNAGTGTGSITVNLPPVDASVKTSTDGNYEFTYKLYRVFDGVKENNVVNYTLKSNHSDVPAGFKLTTVGTKNYVTYVGAGQNNELTAADIAAIKGYVTDADKVADITVNLKTDTSFTVDNLPYGYYYLASTTGSLVVIDNAVENVTLTDKNEVPGLKKKFDTTKASADSVWMDDAGKKAIAQLGKDVPYDVTITIGKGQENYTMWDKMGAGLTYNNDVKVQLDGNDVDPQNYIATFDANDKKLSVAFVNAYTDTLAAGKELHVLYSAKVANEALTVTPEKNTAYLEYGPEGDKHNTPKDETETYSAKISVVKKDQNDQPLAGAGFVIQKDGTPKKYYKFVAATATESAKVEWVDEIDDATEYVSGTDGNIKDADGNDAAFVGLKNGKYILIEKTVPANYNKADDIAFTIKDSDYSKENLEQSSTVLNVQGVLLPSTGGIGTTIFYIIGGLLIVAAVVFFVVRRKADAE